MFGCVALCLLVFDLLIFDLFCFSYLGLFTLIFEDLRFEHFECCVLLWLVKCCLVLLDECLNLL